MEYKVGMIVEIPTSKLGKEFGKGTVKAVWSNTIQVCFNGFLGQYTISKHEIKIVS